MKVFTWDIIEYLQQVDSEDHLIDVIAIASTELDKLREKNGYCEWSH